MLVTHGASAYGALLNDSWVLDLEYGYAEQVPLPLLASPPPLFCLCTAACGAAAARGQNVRVLGLNYGYADFGQIQTGDLSRVKLD